MDQRHMLPFLLPKRTKSFLFFHVSTVISESSLLCCVLHLKVETFGLSLARSLSLHTVIREHIHSTIYCVFIVSLQAKQRYIEEEVEITKVKWHEEIQNNM